MRRVVGMSLWFALVSCGPTTEELQLLNDGKFAEHSVAEAPWETIVGNDRFQRADIEMKGPTSFISDGAGATPGIGSLFRIAGRGWEPGTLLISDRQTPYEPEYVSPCGRELTRLVSIDATPASALLAESSCTGGASVVNGRYAIGRRTESDPVQIVSLYPRVQARPFDSEALLGITFSELGAVRWIDGPDATAHAVRQTSAGVTVTRLDLESLIPSWSLAIDDAHRDDLVADERGWLYLAFASAEGKTGGIAAIDQHGVQRWRRADAAKPIAAFDGTLVLEGGAVVDSRSGRSLFERAADEALLTRSHLFTLSSCGEECRRVAAFDRRSGSALFTHTVEISGDYLPVATSTGSVLLVEDRFRPDLSRPHQPVAELRVYEVAESRVTLHLNTDDDHYYRLQQAVLFDGVLALKHSEYQSNGMLNPEALRRFDLPGVHPALAGWASRGGNVRGGGSPEF